MAFGVAQLAMTLLPGLIGYATGKGDGGDDQQGAMSEDQAKWANMMTDLLKSRIENEDAYMRPAMDAIFQNMGNVTGAGRNQLFAPGLFEPQLQPRKGINIQQPDWTSMADVTERTQVTPPPIDPPPGKINLPPADYLTAMANMGDPTKIAEILAQRARENQKDPGSAYSPYANREFMERYKGYEPATNASDFIPPGEPVLPGQNQGGGTPDGKNIDILDGMDVDIPLGEVERKVGGDFSGTDIFARSPIFGIQPRDMLPETIRNLDAKQREMIEEGIPMAVSQEDIDKLNASGDARFMIMIDVSTQQPLLDKEGRFLILPNYGKNITDELKQKYMDIINGTLPSPEEIDWEEWAKGISY